MRAGEGQAGDGTSGARAASAGVGGEREGLTVGADNALVQTGVTDRAAGVRRDRI